MSARLRALTLAAALALWPSLALSHGMTLFATVEGDVVSGHAAYVGGGRAAGASIVLADDRGETLWSGRADEDGAFLWRAAWGAAGPRDVVLFAVDGEGHRAEARIAKARFAPDATTRIGVCADVAAAVEAAVARQIRPLLEAQHAAAHRARLSDLLGGLGVLFGLAAGALWWFERRRRARPEQASERGGGS